MAVTIGQPAPGSTEPGDMYVDLQSRQIWLGVDASVDPSGSVLLSDIESVGPAIVSGVNDAKEYTDVRLTSYAPLNNPTFTGQPRAPNPSYVDDSTVIATTSWVRTLVNSLSAGGRFQGEVTMYSGPVSNIGVGPLAGWALCDGTNGTPDLKDKFIIGAGNKPVGAMNATTKFSTDVKGAHAHDIGDTTLTVAQMPPHTHPVSVSGSGSGSGTTGSGGAHNHTYPTSIGDSGSSMTHRDGSSNDGTMSTSTAPSHTHPFNVTVSVSASGTAASQGGGQGHKHPCSSNGGHDHEITNAQIREAVPYYAMAFIMKL